MDNKDSGISDEFAEMMSSLAAMNAAEKSDTGGYGAVRDDAKEAKIKEALKADASLSSNERSRFNQIFKIFKTVVFPGPEAERLQAEKVTEKMPVDTAQEKALKEEKKEGGFFSKLLGLLPILPLVAKLAALGTALGVLAANFDKIKEAMDKFADKFGFSLPTAGLGGMPKAWQVGKADKAARANSKITKPTPAKPVSATPSKPSGVLNWMKSKGRDAVDWAGSKVKQGTDWVKSLNTKKVLGQIQRAASPSNLSKLIKGIPALGAIIETAFATYDVKSLIDQYANGGIESEEELKRLVGKRILTGLGALGGATLGIALGSFLGGPIGAVLGSVGGDVAGRWVMGKMVDAWGERGAMAMGDYVLKKMGQAKESPEEIQKQMEAFKAREADASFYREPMQDFVVQNGTITPFSDQDDILGMKKGGAIDKLIDNAVSGNKNKLSDSLLQEEVNINRKIAQISQEQTELLRAIAANTSSQARSILAVNNSSNNTTKQFKPLNIRDNFITAY